ncbi:DUF3313 domain-containing protein [bacterium]|nr:DUF3313 domain-containing protein [candidate division CSSED10-310 bacterium]
MNIWIEYGILVVVVAGLALLIRGRLKPPPPAGFLSDYSRLRRDPEVAGLSWWEEPGTNWGDYRAIFLEPVEVHLHAGFRKEKTRAVEPKILLELAQTFHDMAAAELKESYELTEAAGDGILRIRTALTEVKLSNPWINVLAVLSVMVPVHFGGAAMEAEFLDGGTGRILGAVVARGRGSLLHVMPKDLSPGGHAVNTFRGWAKLLRRSLEEVGFPAAGDG